MHVLKSASSFAAGMFVAASLAVPLNLVYSNVPDVSARSDVSLGRSSLLSGAVPPDQSASRRTGGQNRIVRMTDRDKMLLAFQRTCPVCSEQLAGKTTPGKVELTVFVCGPKCIQEFDKAPRETINKWVDTCEANAKALQMP